MNRGTPRLGSRSVSADINFADALRVDGSLRDLYIPKASIADWNALLRWLESGPYKVTISGPFVLDGKLNANEILDYARRKDTVQMGIHLAPHLVVNCHFFCADEIELDVDPKEVRDETDRQSLMDFIGELGDHLAKDVVLTEENRDEQVHFRYRAETKEFLAP